MAKSKARRAKQMKNLIAGTDRLFAALQRVDDKVHTYVTTKAEELEKFADAMEAWQQPEEVEADTQSVN